MPEEGVETFEVFEENWPTVEFFLKLGTQWRWGAMGGCLGLIYQSVEFMLRLYKITDRAAVFEGLQIMEIAALKVFNEKKA